MLVFNESIRFRFQIYVAVVDSKKKFFLFKTTLLELEINLINIVLFCHAILNSTALLNDNKIESCCFCILSLVIK